MVIAKKTCKYPVHYQYIRRHISLPRFPPCPAKPSESKLQLKHKKSVSETKQDNLIPLDWSVLLPCTIARVWSNKAGSEAQRADPKNIAETCFFLINQPGTKPK
jgi:hypothetical protein